MPQDIHGTDLFEIMRTTRSMRRLKPGGERCTTTTREAIYQAKPLYVPRTLSQKKSITAKLQFACRW